MELLIIQITALVLSVVVHEIAHGYSAFLLGDPTAKYAGRLTLNPFKHLDPVGSFLVPVLLIISQVGVVFGWARPVPYNPYNLRDQKYGPAIVGVAGPLSNIFLALVAGVMIRAFLVSGYDGLGLTILALIVRVNLLLTVFNLLPIPPLDGSKLLFTFLPISQHTKSMLEHYGFIILFAFLFIFSSVFLLVFNVVARYFSEIVIGANPDSFF